VTACTLVRTPSLLDPAPYELTLDELMTSVWEGLMAHQTVPCPVCGEEMHPEYAAHTRPIGGSCSTCGSALR
jgi:hypothetical protein